MVMMMLYGQINNRLVLQLLSDCILLRRKNCQPLSTHSVKNQIVELTLKEDPKRPVDNCVGFSMKSYIFGISQYCRSSMHHISREKVARTQEACIPAHCSALNAACSKIRHMVSRTPTLVHRCTA